MARKIGKYWYGLFRDGKLIETQQTWADARSVALLFKDTQYFLDTGAIYEIVPLQIRAKGRAIIKWPPVK